MFIVKTLDTGEIDYYEKIEDVYMNCEGIDVENGLYEFGDDEGNIYEVEWVKKIKSGNLFWLLSWSDQEKYRLKKRD